MENYRFGKQTAGCKDGLLKKWTVNTWEREQLSSNVYEWLVTFHSCFALKGLWDISNTKIHKANRDLVSHLVNKWFSFYIPFIEWRNTG